MSDNPVALVQSYAGEVAQDRQKIREQLDSFTELAVLTQARLDEIADRGFWRRMVSNNTRDLALAMNDIVTLQQMTLAFVVALVRVNGENLAMLRVLRKELVEVRDELGLQSADVETQQSQLLAFQSTLGQALSAVEEGIARAIRQREDGATARRARYPGWVLWAAVAVTAVVVWLLLRGT